MYAVSNESGSGNSGSVVPSKVKDSEYVPKSQRSKAGDMGRADENLGIRKNNDNRRNSKQIDENALVTQENAQRISTHKGLTKAKLQKRFVLATWQKVRSQSFEESNRWKVCLLLYSQKE